MSEKLRTARTTFMPWRDIEMTEAEYADLLRQGLIVTDEPAEPVVELVESKPDAEDEEKPSPAPRRKH